MEVAVRFIVMREDQNEYSEPKKKVPIYFYYLTISKQKDSNDSSTYDMQQIVDSFSKLLPYITKKI